MAQIGPGVKIRINMIFLIARSDIIMPFRGDRAGGAILAERRSLRSTCGDRYFSTENILVH